MKKTKKQILLSPFHFLFASLCRDYRQIFKGGIVLFGITLAGLSQIFPVFLERGHVAM